MFKNAKLASQPKLKLHYFNIRGRAETIRYICAYAGLKYEDTRTEQADWPTVKNDYHFGFLPVLEVDGVRLYQSGPIARYVAKLAGMIIDHHIETQQGLAGNTTLETSRIDVMADVINDMRENIIGVQFEQNEEAKKAKIEKFHTDTPNVLKSFETYANGDYLCGDKLTWADLHFFSLVPILEMMYPDGWPAKNFPKLEKIIKNVSSNKRIAAYIKERPVTAM